MQGANGQEIEILGKIRTTLVLNDFSFEVDAIVCDILPDGILGQGFLLNHATSIDYKNNTIYTEKARIKCWTGGQARAIMPSGHFL